MKMLRLDNSVRRLILIIAALTSTLKSANAKHGQWMPKVGEIHARASRMQHEVQADPVSNAPRDDMSGIYTALDNIHGSEEQLGIVVEEIRRTVDDMKMNNGSGEPSEHEECLTDMMTWQLDTGRRELYARKMWDSWAVKQGGILEGNVRWPGHYWECVGSVGETVQGQWCNAFYGFKYEPLSDGIPIDASFGTCFPASCNEIAVTGFVRALTGNKTRIPLLQVNCNKLDTSWGPLQIAAIVVSAILISLSVVGTAVGVFVSYYGPSQNLSQRMILCFSILKNGERLLDTKKPSGMIPALDGIRVISTLWVILSHSYFFPLALTSNIISASNDAMQNFLLLPVYNGTFSVDTFFCLSGLLVAYLTLKVLTRTRGKLNIPLMYLQRYLRLTPLYAFLILFTMGLYKFLGSGPYWPAIVEKGDSLCADTWWTNLLYINNVYPAEVGCFEHGWYLACDMQFYLLSPIFIYLLYKYPKIGVSFTMLIVIGGMIGTGLITEKNGIQPNMIGGTYLLKFWYRLLVNSSHQETYEERLKYDIYYVPWYRFGAYLIGILTGYVLFTWRGKIKMNKIIVLCGWLMSVGSGLAIVYGTYGYTSNGETMQNLDLAAFYNAVTRPMWAACVGWVVIACSSGYGGPATTLLDWNAFLPLSRLTYGAYLIHPFVAYWEISVREFPVHYSTVESIYRYIGTTVLSFGLAFVTALVVEMPIQELVRMGFPRVKHSPKSINKAEKFEKSLPEYSKAYAGESNGVSAGGEGGEKSYRNEAFHDEKDECTPVVVTTF